MSVTVTLFDINTPAANLQAGITTSVGDYDTLNESIAKAAIKIKYINIYSASAAQVAQIYQVLKKDVFGNECLYYELPVIDPNQRQNTTLNVKPAKDIILDGSTYMQFSFTTNVRLTFYWEKIWADSKQMKSDGECNECFDAINVKGDNPDGTENFFYIEVSTQAGALAQGSAGVGIGGPITLNNGAYIIVVRR